MEALIQSACVDLRQKFPRGMLRSSIEPLLWRGQRLGVVCTVILLPPQAPAGYRDRATLWNDAEKAERGKKAQLAYSFDIALPRLPAHIDMAFRARSW